MNATRVASVRRDKIDSFVTRLALQLSHPPHPVILDSKATYASTPPAPVQPTVLVGDTVVFCFDLRVKRLGSGGEVDWLRGCGRLV